MHSSGSLLLTALERVRIHLDEASLDPKFSNNDIISHFIEPAYKDVWARINMNTEQPLVMRVQLALVAGTQFYMLPWGCGEIWRVCATDTQGNILTDWKPRGKQHPSGPGWTVEGNMLSLQPIPQTSDSTNVFLWYVPSGDFQMHYSPAGGAYDSGTKVFTLDTAPTYGTFDRRPGAYIGQCLRLLPAAGIWQDRYILSYTDATSASGNKNVKFFVDPVPTPSASSLAYEIAAPGMEAFMEAVALSAARKMGTSRKISQAHREAMIQEFKSAMKTVLDSFANIQTRTGKSFERMTEDRLVNGLTRME